MNWLFRFKKLAQQTIPLNMKSLMELGESPYAETAASLLRMFDKMFTQIPQLLTNEPILTDVDASNLGNEIFIAVKENDDLQFDDWDDTWNFITTVESEREHLRSKSELRTSFHIDGLTYSEEPGAYGPMINGIALRQADPATLSEFVNKIRKLGEYIEEAKDMVAGEPEEAGGDWNSEMMVGSGWWEGKEVRQFYDQYKAGLEQIQLVIQQNPGWQNNFNELVDSVTELSITFLSLMRKSETGETVPPPQLPWIDAELFKRSIKANNINKSTEWFMNKNPEFKAGLLADAQRRHRDAQVAALEDSKIQFDHAHGMADTPVGETSWLNALRMPFNGLDEGDPRLSLDAKTLSTMSGRIAALQVRGANETSQVIALYVVAIQMKAMSDPNLTDAFGNSLEYAPDRDRARAGAMAAEGTYTLPEVFQGRSVREISGSIETHFSEMRDFFENIKRIVKTRNYEYSEAEAVRLRELGILSKPMPGIKYRVQEERFPGMGYLEGEEVGRVGTNFQIAIAPTAEYLQQKGLPEKIFSKYDARDSQKGMHLHGSARDIDGLAPIGWVGGWVDPETREMFVFETQSDIMQRSGFMRDSVKLEDERKARAFQLEADMTAVQQQITDLQTGATQPKKKKGPKDAIRANIRRIRADIEQAKADLDQLSQQNQAMEQQADFDPNHPGYLHNKQVIDTKLKAISKFTQQLQRMEENLARIPDPVEPELAPEIQQPEGQPVAPEGQPVAPEGQPVAPEGQVPELPQQLQQKINKLQNKLQNLEVELIESKKPVQPLTGSYVWPHWHDYRSKLETAFKDWIPIFWNTAVREAKQMGIVSLYIVHSDELMKIWAGVLRGKTAEEKELVRGLYKRVYDKIAEGYGATEVNYRGRKFFRIDINDPNLRFASNWFMRAPYDSPYARLVKINWPKSHGLPNTTGLVRRS